MTAEFTPARRRTLAVTATIVCYPLGGMIAGLFASAVARHYKHATVAAVLGVLCFVGANFARRRTA